MITIERGEHTDANAELISPSIHITYDVLWDLAATPEGERIRDRIRFDVVPRKRGLKLQLQWLSAAKLRVQSEWLTVGEFRLRPTFATIHKGAVLT